MSRIRPRACVAVALALVASCGAVNAAAAASATGMRIASGPLAGAHVSTANPAFRIVRSDARIGAIQRRIDRGPWRTSSVRATTPRLADGRHVVSFRGLDRRGRLVPGSTTTRSFVVDTRAPDTTIVSLMQGPGGLLVQLASADRAARFQVRLDARAWRRATATSTIAVSDPGAYLVSARAIDRAGNVDRSPSEYWIEVRDIRGTEDDDEPAPTPDPDPTPDTDPTPDPDPVPDTTAPVTTFASAPGLQTSDTTPTLEFEASEPGVTFHCAVDDGDFGHCAAQFTAPALSGGGREHHVRVYAVDAAGNQEVSPKRTSFVVVDPDPAPTGSILRGPEEVVFDHSEDACETWDIPDGPARAYREADGNVTLLSTHYDMYRNRGATLDTVEHECSRLMPRRTSPLLHDWTQYTNWEWLWSPYTLDGTTVHSLVHNEFQGHNSPDWSTVCPSKVYSNCWYNSIGLATSTDGGATFTRPSGQAGLVVKPPLDYVPDGGMQGAVEPTNIVAHPTDGHYYAMMLMRQSSAQDYGVCTMRTTDVSDPNSWRGWDGTAFAARMWLGERCQPVLMMMWGSVTWNTYYDKFILVGVDEPFWTAPGDGHPQGYYDIRFRVSDDLVNWSAPVKLLDTKGFAPVSALPLRHYPALLDPRTGSRNFDQTGRFPYLYYTTYAGDTQATSDRDLRRVPIELPAVPPS